MKRVGIMTWYYGANYGAIAQSVALYNTVCSLGYECVMINYRPQEYLKTVVGANIPKKGKRLWHMGETIKGIKKCISLSKTKEYLQESKKVKTAKEIDDLQLDCIIFGSDAIFNIKHPLCDSLYYGVGIKTKKITYSPSCEYLDVNTELPSEYRKSLLEMKQISVRDQNTYDLIKRNIDYEALITLDPTFLYDFSDISSSEKLENYILIYSFSEWSEYKTQIINYAKKNNLEIISLGMQRDWADKSFTDSSFELWIESFRKAEFVITDSFHGTVFSLKNNKQIVLCGRSDKAAKINSLLQQLSVNIDVYKGENLEQYLEKNYINYNRVQISIESRKEESVEYLKKALIS